jgi:hypothetical protein
MSHKPKESQSQFNLGLYQREAVNQMALEFDKLRLIIRDQGLPRVTRAQIAFPLFKTGVRALKIWTSPRGLSLFESLTEAKKDVLKDLISHNIDDYLLKLMSGVFEVAKRHADEVAEVMLTRA